MKPATQLLALHLHSKIPFLHSILPLCPFRFDSSHPNQISQPKTQSCAESDPCSMKFGKEFRTHLEETLPDWRDKFLCYKPLKKLLKNLPSGLDSLPPTLHRHAHSADDATGARPLLDLQEWFVGLLNEELEKFNDFYVDKEEEFVIRFQELKERIELLKEKSRGGVISSGSEFGEEMMDIRKDFVTIHGEMVLLKNYSSLNFAGLVKILKKYDKRTGELLRLPFTQLAVQEPFFTTEPLSRLVRECEANLELLFPLEAEVVESNSNQPINGTANISVGTSSNLGDETMDVYRSTLAAMRAIRGLQGASSTHNPLSFSSIFRSRDDDNSTGAVTDENNSGSNSSASLRDGDDHDTDQEDARSV